MLFARFVVRGGRKRGNKRTHGPRIYCNPCVPRVNKLHASVKFSILTGNGINFRAHETQKITSSGKGILRLLDLKIKISNQVEVTAVCGLLVGGASYARREVRILQLNQMFPSHCGRSGLVETLDCYTGNWSPLQHTVPHQKYAHVSSEPVSLLYLSIFECH